MNATDLPTAAWEVVLDNTDGPHPVRGEYVRTWWLPPLGPTATALLQLLPEGLSADAEDPVRFPTRVRRWLLTDLSCRLGLGRSSSTLVHALDRLATWRVVTLAPDLTIHVPSHLHSLDGRARSRLTPAASLAHSLYLGNHTPEAVR